MNRSTAAASVVGPRKPWNAASARVGLHGVPRSGPGGDRVVVHRGQLAQLPTDERVFAYPVVNVVLVDGTFTVHGVTTRVGAQTDIPPD